MSAGLSEESLEEQGESAQEILFFPPLWQQRRNLARRIIDEHHATSVIDFGCGEAALMSFLIWESSGEHPITRLSGVDMDESRLTLATDACQPQDYELGSNLRVNKLAIEIYHGSVAQADSRMIGFDALACLEVVEHLDPDVLEQFWGVVLGKLRPKLVIVSTPNAEFNVYFPQLKYGTPEAVFRNDDHRFEWTRQEFEDWCKQAAKECHYNVSFTGVGMLSHGDPAVGCCTQFAILTRDDSPSPTATSATIAETAETTKSGTQEFYNLFSRIDYPTYETVHTDEEALEFLHDKIARIRPRPPLERTEDDYYDDYWINGCMQNGQVQDSGATEAKDNKESTPESEIELGVLDLEDLWGSLDVRQRCKRRSEFIRILGTSSLVRLDVAEDKIRYDEESAFWKEWDERDARRYALHDTLDPTGSDCNEYNDDDQYETEPYNEKHLSLVECQQEEGWDNQGQHFDSWSENVQSPWLQSSQSAWSETEWHTKHDTKDTEEVYSP